MTIDQIPLLFAHRSEYTRVRQEASTAGARLHLRNLQGSSSAVLMAALAGDPTWNHPILCIAQDEDSAGYLYNDLCTLLGEKQSTEDVLFLPSLYRRSIRYGQADIANEVLRTQVIDRLRSERQPHFVVTYPDALMERVPCECSTSTAPQRLVIRIGVEIERRSFREQLWEMGFEECDYVYQPGQFAVRGSLIDIFSFAHDLPVRIDFFGNEVESLHPFNPQSQLSEGDMEEVTIIPALSLTAGESEPLMTLMSPDTVVYVGHWSFLEGTLTGVYTQPPVHPEDNIFKTLEQMQRVLVEPKQFYRDLDRFAIIAQNVGAEGLKNWLEIDFHQNPEPLFHKNFDLLSDTLLSLQSDGYVTAIMSSQPSQLRRFENIFVDQGKAVSFTPLMPTLSAGFIDPQMKVALFSDHSIFERFYNYELKSDRIRKNSSVLTLKEIQSFEYGDYVVHINHGIGTFGGLFTMEQNGKNVEVVRLNFRGGGSIFVSIHSLHHISKYKSKDSEDPPQLSKLGSSSWDKIKERTKKRVKDIARDLIKIYAQRLEVKGFAYSPDNYLQDELEASFQYEDTPDQERATADVKSDMEKPVPMDRLICGDVGFGKTEVAIRAAFKAVCDSKQVAVMVPTTVLAYQHYHTFCKRLNGFPCRIEYLSQSKGAKERRQILEELKAGRIDIIIGTHTLAGKAVEYRDLGLLIIDEEQKFGVAAKERLRAYRAHVDTLTLTATPIPRTLQFSLMGARDLSNIQTPPPNRYPIRTDHSSYSMEVLSDAINAELARDGQVFFIHNRIHNIEDIARDIRKAVPGIRIAIGHGQMPSRELEDVLLDFVNHEYDLLLATSIVENGIDVPNANTIIINDAQRFGLSDLHQLRGRVGRGNSKAYCLLLTPPLDSLTPNARRRIQSITSFSELGSGIHIAMQDLDIRGAGNLLGSEQSGFIADLGYETYRRILEEAVMELKDEEFSELFGDHDTPSADNLTDASPSAHKTGRREYVYDTNVETDVEAYFPQTYVPGDDERISLYQELDGIQRRADLQTYRARLLDRFGPLPQEAEELLKVVDLRLLGKRCGVEKILLKRSLLKLYLVSDNNSGYYRSNVFATILANATTWGRELSFKEEDGKRSISVRGVDSIAQAFDVLHRLSNLSL